MGGVDRSDQLRAYNTVARKSNIWWKQLLYFLVDICGTKAELVLQVTLLKSKQLYLIFEKERVMITQAVYTAKDLIIAQKSMSLNFVTNVYR